MEGKKTITLSPEQERLIDKAMQTGAYANPDDVIGRALAMLQSEDEWKTRARIWKDGSPSGLLNTAVDDQFRTLRRGARRSL